ncbi:MAG TPA: hypothetical protein VJ785_01040 [Anaerolineales bacterium]|nr:hypothetical protein [Anaerolineales bacterium]
MFNIWKDMKSGALPAREFPGFLFWTLRKFFWLSIVVILVGTIMIFK